MDIIDIIFVAIVVINGLIAFNRGLIKTLFNFFSSIVAVVLSYMFYPALSNIIVTMTKLDDTIQTKIVEGLNLDKLTNGIATKQDEIKLINNLELPAIVKEQLLSNNNPEVYQFFDVTAIKDYISHMLSQAVINVISFIILFIVFTVLLGLIANMLDLIAKLPVVKQVNKGAGLIVGILWGTLINWIICVVIFFIGGLGLNTKLLLTIEQSSIAKLFYLYNPLVDLVGNLSNVLK